MSCYAGDDCRRCELDSNNVATCAECNLGFYWDSSELECIECSSKFSGCALCAEDSCFSCSTNQSFLLQNGSCVSCGIITGTPPGKAGCSICSMSENTVSCEVCQTGYYLNDSDCVSCADSSFGNCVQCSNSTICESCAPGNYLNAAKTTCTGCTKEKCTYCPDDLCSQCEDSFYWNGTDCQSCISNCKSCSSDSGCEICENGFYSSDCSQTCMEGCLECNAADVCQECDSNYNQSFSYVKQMSCYSECPDGTYYYKYGKSYCVDCILKYWNCSECNSNYCTKCNNDSAYYLLADGRGCISCNETTDQITNSICYQQPKAHLINVTIENFRPWIPADCGVNSYGYYVYGLGSSVDNVTLEDIYKISGEKTSKTVGATDLTDTWMGYGSGLPDEINDIRIFNILKNSGETYKIKGFCVSTAGGLIDSDNITWVQPSNGGKYVVLKITTNSSLDSDKKQKVGFALKSVLNNLDRSIYTDDGDPVQQKESSRLLQTSSSGLTTKFIIVPDYTITEENMSTIVNQTITSSSFITNFNSALSSEGISIANVTVEKTISVEPTPTLSTTTPAINSNESSISFSISITNTDGYLYVGLGPSNNASSLSWSHFMASKDSNNVNFFSNYTSYEMTMGVSQTITIDNLSLNTTYNLYFAASNSLYPRKNSSIYIVTASTNGTSSSNSTSNSTFGNRKTTIGVLIALIMIIMVLV